MNEIWTVILKIDFLLFFFFKCKRMHTRPHLGAMKVYPYSSNLVARRLSETKIRKKEKEGVL